MGPREQGRAVPAYDAGQIAALRDLIATWLRLAIFETMTGGEGDRRSWLIIDELDALGQIDGLKDALARLRRFGGRCVLGFQSIAQVRGTYGDAEAQTIVENRGNTLILRVLRKRAWRYRGIRLATIDRKAGGHSATSVTQATLAFWWCGASDPTDERSTRHGGYGDGLGVRAATRPYRVPEGGFAAGMARGYRDP